MLRSLFRKNNHRFFVSPMTGRVMPITDIPDPVFSSKAMGDGFGIEPESGRVASPVNGLITLVFETKHAIGIRASNGIELIIHFGLDSVNLKGEGFEVLVKQNQKVRKGQDILMVDIEKVKSKASSIISPIVFTNLNDKRIKLLKTGFVNILEPDIIALE